MYLLSFYLSIVYQSFIRDWNLRRCYQQSPVMLIKITHYIESVLKSKSINNHFIKYQLSAEYVLSSIQLYLELKQLTIQSSPRERKREWTNDWGVIRIRLDTSTAICYSFRTGNSTIRTTGKSRSEGTREDDGRGDGFRMFARIEVDEAIVIASLAGRHPSSRTSFKSGTVTQSR